MRKKGNNKDKYFVYILECNDGSYYTGYTKDLEERVKRHNEGFASKYTKSRLLVRVVWKKKYKYFKKAIKSESKIKKLTRKQKEKLVKGMRLDKVLAKSDPGEKLQGKCFQHLPCSPRTRQPKVLIKTFGCQMNKRDTEIAKDILSDGSFVFTNDENEADVILFNTCSVRKHAEDRVIGKMGMLSKEKFAESSKSEDRKSEKQKNKKTKRNPESEIRYPILGIIGCMATYHGEKLFDKVKGLNLICGPQNIHNLRNDIKKAIEENKKVIDIEQKKYLDKYECIRGRDSKVTAWVSIMEGCNNFCSYCVVPYTRGREVSRPADKVVEEINRLVDEGFKEITLLGQNVNSYKVGIAHGSKLIADSKKNNKEENEIRHPISKIQSDFVELLRRINDETDIKRIRFTTSHPKDTSEELFKTMRDLNKVCPHLHLPLQSGSDKILTLMNRNYSSENYKSLVNKLRDIYPECTISTDIIVGFPSETGEDFKETYELMKEIKFDGAYIFKYSSRPNTEASKLEDNVPKESKKERNKKLLNLQDKISYKKNQKYLDKKVNVLVENHTDKKIYLNYENLNNSFMDNPNLEKYTGRTPENKLVLFKGKKDLIGEEVEVTVNNSTTHSLVGVVEQD